MSGSLHMYTLHTFMTLTGTALPLPLTLRKDLSLELRSCFCIFLPVTTTEVTRQKERLWRAYCNLHFSKDMLFYYGVGRHGRHCKWRRPVSRFHSRTKLVQQIHGALRGRLSLGIERSSATRYQLSAERTSCQQNAPNCQRYVAKRRKKNSNDFSACGK